MTLEKRIKIEEKNLGRAEHGLKRGSHIQRDRLCRAEAKRILTVLYLVRELPIVEIRK